MARISKHSGTVHGATGRDKSSRNMVGHTMAKLRISTVSCWYGSLNFIRGCINFDIEELNLKYVTFQNGLKCVEFWFPPE